MIVSATALFDALRQHRLLDEEQIDRVQLEFSRQTEASAVTTALVGRGLLTAFQAELLLRGEAAELSIGQHVVLDRLGEGGMGKVLKARHRRLKRIDALKLIHPDCLTSKLAVRRFFHEAQIVAQLNHPNVIKVYDAAEDGDRHYFVMECVAGIDLGRLLQQQGRLPVMQACEFVRQAALGLQHAHEKKLVHRDIKPSNLMLSHDDGIVKVLDLGLARLREQNTDGGDAVVPLTPHGMMMGTPDFMAPEQTENASAVDIRADIYSLGCTLYQLLTGSVPFPARSLVEKLQMHHTTPPPSLRGSCPAAPAELAGVFEKMLAKSPSGRYQEPAEVALALAPFAGHVPVGVPVLLPTLVPQDAVRETDLLGERTPQMQVGCDEPTMQVRRSPVIAPRPRRRRLVAAGLLLLAAAGGVAGVLWPRGGDVEPVVQRQEEVPPVPPKTQSAERGAQSAKTQSAKTQSAKTQSAESEAQRVKTIPLPAPRSALHALRSTAVGKAGDGTGAGQVKGREWQRVGVLSEFAEPVEQAAFAGDGSRLAVRVRTSLTAYSLMGPVKAQQLPSFIPRDPRFTERAGMGDVVLSPDGRHVVFAAVSTTTERVAGMMNFNNEYDTLARWDGTKLTLCFGVLATSSRAKMLQPPRCLAYTPDGRGLIAGAGTCLYRWNVGRTQDYHEHTSRVDLQDEPACLACSPDGKHVVAGSSGQRLYLLQLQGDWKHLPDPFEGHGSTVRCAAFVGPEHIVSGDSDGKVCLWRIPAGQERKPLLTLEGWRDQAVLAAAGSPAGDAFAVGGVDGKVRVGKIGVKEMAMYEEFAGAEVRALAFTPDGRQLLVATEKKLGVILLAPREGAEKN